MSFLERPKRHDQKDMRFFKDIATLLIGDRTGSLLHAYAGQPSRTSHSRAVGGGTPQTCPGSAPRRPADSRIKQGVLRDSPAGEGQGGTTGGAVA